VTATPVILPQGFFVGDINLQETQLRGTLSLDDNTGVYRITGAGHEIAGKADHCFFASRPITGDFTLTARILDRPSNVHPGTSAGLMIRQGLDAGSRMLFLAGTANRGLTAYVRPITDGAAVPVGPAVVSDREFLPPYSLRISRRGNSLLIWVSRDGFVWRPAPSPLPFAPAMPPTLYAGYAITAARPGNLVSNTFRDLTLQTP
jgi:hypothetical protein